MIEPATGALVLPNLRVDRDLTRTLFLASPWGSKARCSDMRNGWVHFYLGPETLAGENFIVTLAFDGERLRSYDLRLADPKYGTSWDDYSEEKQLAMRDAHDAWLMPQLGSGERKPSMRGPELYYSFLWGEVWSTFDAKGGSTSIIVRLR